MKNISLYLFFILITSYTNATTYTVTSTASTGSGSLYQAIEDANNNPGVDTIIFDASLDGSPITLGFAGSFIFEEVHIIGNGIENTIIDGTNTGEVLFLSLTNDTIYFSGIQFTNAEKGVFHGDFVNIDSCYFFQNSNDSGGIGQGGALYLESGLSVISNSFFKSNIAEEGGAIYNHNSFLTIESCVFVNNIVFGLAGKGGAIYSQSLFAPLKISNSTLFNNLSGNIAGAIWISDESFESEITNCTIAFNQTSPLSSSGAIHIVNSGVPTFLKMYNSIAYSNETDIYMDQGCFFIANEKNIVGNCFSIDSACPTWFSTTDPQLDHENPIDCSPYPESLAVASLLPTSIAIDNANPTFAPALDQCGLQRLSNPDIGAHEINGSTLSILDNEVINQFKVFPNPTLGDFTIDLKQNFPYVKVSIINLNGQIIKSSEYSNSQILNLNFEAAAGIYFVSIETPSKKEIVKLIKK